MARGLFGRRRENGPVEGAADWPQLPVTTEPPAVPGLDAPALAYVQAIASAVPAVTSDPPGKTPEAALLSHIAACRSAVADALYESSRDYQVLCDLVHENLPACTEAIEELRRRLAGNLHYTVLAKLDEAYALAEAGVADKGR